MFAKKAIVAALASTYVIGSGVAAQDAADDGRFVYKPFGLNPIAEAAVPTWSVQSSDYTEWQNSGTVFDCDEWAPPEELVDLFEPFVQSRECSQLQNRQRVDNLFSIEINATRQEGPFTETQSIRVNQTQDAIGSRDYIVGEVENEWSEWSDVGGFYSCGSFSPSPEEVDFGTAYTKSRDCLQDQTRNRSVFNEYRSGDQQFLRTEVQDQTITVTDSESDTGTRRDWQETASTFTEWSDFNAPYDFQEWTPAPTNQVSTFEQVQLYSQDQLRNEQRRERDQVTGDIRNVGGPVIQTRTVERSNTRDVTVSFSEWADNGGLYDCDSWPALDTTTTADQNQTRSCSQEQQRTRTYSTGESFTENRTVSGSESRTVTASVGDWVDTTQEGFDGWLPEATTQTTSFTQTRNFSQNQSATITYKVGSDTVGSGTLTRTIDTDEERTVTVSFSDWTDAGGLYDCNSWPAINTSTTSNQNQSRSCSQDQERTRSYSSGESFNETRTVSATESRTVTASVGNYTDTSRTGYSSWSPAAGSQTTSFNQSRSYSQNQSAPITYRVGSTTVGTGSLSRSLSRSESRTVTVSYSGWSNSGGVYSCSGYSPAASTQTSNFVQTFTCRQNQTRVRSYSTGQSATESRTVNVSQSRTVVVSAGANGSSSSATPWSPIPGNQTSSYTQSRTVTTTNSRTYSFSIGGSHTVVSTSNGNENRSVGVSAGGWANVGSPYSCSGWAHSTNTSSPATRTCSQNQSRTWTHRVGGATIYTRGETRTISVTQTAGPTGGSTTQTGGYANSSQPQCGEYNPPPSEITQGVTYTQAALCSQQQSRTVQTLTTYSNGFTYVTATNVETRTVNTVQYRQAVGTCVDGGIGGLSFSQCDF